MRENSSRNQGGLKYQKLYNWGRARCGPSGGSIQIYSGAYARMETCPYSGAPRS